MKWRESTPWLAVSDAGYKVAKFVDDGQAIYRASARGEFIGSPKSSFDECRQVCENHYQIMGDQNETSDSSGSDTETA